MSRKSTPTIVQLQRQLDQFRSTQPRRMRLPESNAFALSPAQTFRRDLITRENKVSIKMTDKMTEKYYPRSMH